ncbi:MAG: hypothetical protein KDD66_16480 [Bdellovibrionales bacterium]|nr:hypothetical protein [Bdellovibrionales bacterium]
MPKDSKKRLHEQVELVRESDRVDLDLLPYVEYTLRQMASQLQLDELDLTTPESAEKSFNALSGKLEEINRQKKLVHSLKMLLKDAEKLDS